MLGVGLLVLGPEARLDLWGVLAGLGGALSMALGVVLSRRWQPPVGALTFTAWQLTAGGLLLLPVTALSLPQWPHLSLENLLGAGYLGLIGGAFAYLMWFRGIARIAPSTVSLLGVFSPLTAVILGALLAHEKLTAIQAVGAVIALASVWLGQQKPKTTS